MTIVNAEPIAVNAEALSTKAYRWGVEDAENDLPCSPELYVGNFYFVDYIEGYRSVKPHKPAACPQPTLPTPEQQRAFAWAVEWERCQEADRIGRDESRTPWQY